jgi:hypothetical protein
MSVGPLAQLEDQRQSPHLVPLPPPLLSATRRFHGRRAWANLLQAHSQQALWPLQPIAEVGIYDSHQTSSGRGSRYCPVTIRVNGDDSVNSSAETSM